MSKIILYMHSGSKNHGCEALARTIRNNIKSDNVDICSNNLNEDVQYGLDKCFREIIARKKIKKYSLTNIISKGVSIVIKNRNSYYKKLYSDLLNNISEGDLAISIGGDTYCYNGIPPILGFLNKQINLKNAKTALIGCSIEPSLLTKTEIVEDLKRYSLICARETITYNALIEAGIDKNTKLIPDSAFTLEKIDKDLPENFIEGKTIGINVSPLIQRLENGNNITYQNYLNLIKYIIENTDNNIALVPHVVWSDNNDIEPLTNLYNEFKDTNRVVLIEDCNCMELKGYISKCKFFIGARTHATIAAYSTNVPTLVVGYSVKAKGIANDIFGTYENYVLPVQSLKNENDLTEAFKWIMNNENSIRKHLEEVMPEYINKVSVLQKEISKIIGEKNED